MSNNCSTTTIDVPLRKSRQWNFGAFCRAVVERCPLPLAEMYWQRAVRRWETEEARLENRYNENVHQKIGSPSRVVSGPFMNMEYGMQAGCGAWLPRLLGVYEKELAAAIEDVVASGIREIVDVGAAEGYYAVGLAKRLPKSRVVSFELEPYYRHLCRRLAASNGVANQLDVRSECKTATLRDATKNFDRWFLLCDCEGFEDRLLDPDSVPTLRTAVILVETHDFCCEGVTDRLVSRFRATHQISTLQTTERTLKDWSFGDQVPVEERVRILNELRPARQSWLYMKPCPCQ